MGGRSELPADTVWLRCFLESIIEYCQTGGQGSQTTVQASLAYNTLSLRVSKVEGISCVFRGANAKKGAKPVRPAPAKSGVMPVLLAACVHTQGAI